MNLLVCMKQVPEKDSRYKVNDLGTWVREEDLVFETNESDQYALEEALRLREKLGGEVAVISLGAVRAQKTLKSALAMGADRAVHVSSEQLQQSDASVIAKVIQRAIQGEQFDLIFTGVQSDDMSFAQTGTILAQLMGWNHATIVMEVEVKPSERTVQVKRELESNIFERVELPLPAVLTIQSGINQPRYATLKGIMQAKKKELKVLTLEDLTISPDQVGIEGSDTIPVKLSAPERKKKTVLLEGEPDAVARTLFEKLRKEARVL